MVIFLITSVLALGLIAIALYFWQRPAHKPERYELPPPPPSSLFSDFRINQLLSPPEEPVTELEPPKVDAQLFEQAIEAIREYQRTPDRNSTAKLLHAAALSDDAKNYGRAIELVLMSWRDGSLADLSAKDLQSLFNSEYWVLSSRTRTSGAGFVLKETLSRANRELELTNAKLNQPTASS
jgi:hypothetical protein